MKVKKMISIFMVVLILIGASEMQQGMILTIIFTFNLYSQNAQEMVIYLQYLSLAITITLSILGMYKLKKLVEKYRLSGRLS